MLIPHKTAEVGHVLEASKSRPQLSLLMLRLEWQARQLMGLLQNYGIGSAEMTSVSRQDT